MSSIRKDLLKQYRFSDNPRAWIYEARSFFDAGRILRDALGRRARSHPRLISLTESTENIRQQKIVCFLFSISIELFLKGLYSASRTANDKKTESFGHKVTNLNLELIKKGIIAPEEPSTEILEIAETILEWSGRYHKPTDRVVDKVIRDFFVESKEHPEMVSPKFNINLETTNRLQNLAAKFYDTLPQNGSHIDQLLFLPF